MSHPDISDDEMQRRVLHAVSHPFVKLSARFGVALPDTLNSVRLAFFDVAKRAGGTLKEVGETLGISERQAKRLQQQLREHFLDVEAEHSLPTRIEFLCWATPVSRTKLKQLLSGWSAPEIDRAVDRLLEDGRLREESGRTARLHASHTVNSLVRDTWIARLGGLTSLLANVTDVVFGRFFVRDDRAFSRTMSFLIRSDDVPELERFFTEQLVPFLTQLDQRAREGEDSQSFRMSLLWAPFDLIDTED